MCWYCAGYRSPCTCEEDCGTEESPICYCPKKKPIGGTVIAEKGFAKVPGDQENPIPLAESGADSTAPS